MTKECCFIKYFWLLWYEDREIPAMIDIENHDEYSALVGSLIDPHCFDGWREDLIRNGYIDIDGKVQKIDPIIDNPNDKQFLTD